MQLEQRSERPCLLVLPEAGTNEGHGREDVEVRRVGGIVKEEEEEKAT